MKLITDKDGAVVQGFAPKSGKVIDQGVYTPLRDEVIFLGIDVDITIDGITITYPIGSVLVLAQGSSVEFGVSTPVHCL